MRREDFEEIAKTQNDHWWFKGKRRIINRVIKLKIYNNTPLKILEIGSGTGAVLPVLSRYGYVTAMELDDYARNFIKAGKNITVVKGSLPYDIEAVEDEKFDLICMFDVLEHIENDSKALDSLKKILAPDGKILLTVPAYQWLYSLHDKNMGHYRRYTKKSLNALFLEQGFDVLYSTYMNTFLFPLMAAARIFDRIRKNTHRGGGALFRL